MQSETETLDRAAKATPQPLTVEQLEQAIKELPKHRTDLIESAKRGLRLIKSGCTIRDNAPMWIQIQNVIYVSKIGSDEEDAEQL
jgi:hypothetical protein